MKHFFHKFKNFIQRLNVYYTEAEVEIAQINLNSLRFCCFAGILFLLFFCFVAPYIISDWKITPEYYAALAVFFLFLVLYYLIRAHKRSSPKTIEAVCALFYGICLATLIAISVFPYPDTPQFYLTSFYIFMPVMLIQRPILPLLIMTLSEIVFLVLARIYKSPVCLEQDTFNSIAAIAFSLIVLVMVNRLRLSDYNARTELRKLGRCDGLTGLLNKVTFEEIGREENSVSGDALIVLDMDDFKKINDRFGHMAGDELLAKVGTVLQGVFRSSDLVGRIGGDEFCVLMRGLSQTEDVEVKIKQIQERVSQIELLQSFCKITCSIGAAFPIHDGATYEETFQVADENLYQAKNSGKDTYRIGEVKIQKSNKMPE